MCTHLSFQRLSTFLLSIQSSIRTFIHPSIHLPTHPSNHPLIHPLLHQSARPSVNSWIHPSNHPSILALIIPWSIHFGSPTYQPTYPVIHSFVVPFLYLLFFFILNLNLASMPPMIYDGSCLMILRFTGHDSIGDLNGVWILTFSKFHLTFSCLDAATSRRPCCNLAFYLPQSTGVSLDAR